MLFICALVFQPLLMFFIVAYRSCFHSLLHLHRASGTCRPHSIGPCHLLYDPSCRLKSGIISHIAGPSSVPPIARHVISISCMPRLSSRALTPHSSSNHLISNQMLYTCFTPTGLRSSSGVVSVMGHSQGHTLHPLHSVLEHHMSHSMPTILISRSHTPPMPHTFPS